MNELTTVYIRELHAHNCGYIVEKPFDLSDYTDESGFEEARNEWLETLPQEYPDIYKDHTPEETMVSVWNDSLSHLLSEYSIDPDIWEILEVRPDDIEVCLAFVSWYGGWDLSDFEDTFRGVYSYELQAQEQLVDEYLECSDDIPEHLENYIDYDKLGQSLMMDYHFDDKSGALFRSV